MLKMMRMLLMFTMSSSISIRQQDEAAFLVRIWEAESSQEEVDSKFNKKIL